MDYEIVKDYKKRKEEETVSMSPEKETTKEIPQDDKVDGSNVNEPTAKDDNEGTKELEAKLLGENDTTGKNEEEQVQSGGSSPTSPAFEVETAPAPQPVDPKEVLTELGMYKILVSLIWTRDLFGSVNT